MKIQLAMFFLMSFVMIAQDGGLQHSTLNTQGQGFDEVPTILKNRVGNFFETLKSENINKAYEELLQNSPIMNQKEDLNNLVVQTRRAIGLYGKIYNNEPVYADLVSNSYIRLNYLGIHSNYPVRWIFTFYRSPKHDWIITNIKFDDLSEYYFRGN
jgi:hypothetical protein